MKDHTRKRSKSCHTSSYRLVPIIYTTYEGHLVFTRPGYVLAHNLLHPSYRGKILWWFGQSNSGKTDFWMTGIHSWLNLSQSESQKIRRTDLAKDSEDLAPWPL